MSIVNPDTNTPQASGQGGQAQVSAFAESGTEYSNFSPESIQVDVAGDEPVDFINNILCFISQVVPQDNIDAGKYVAMVEEGQCFGGDTAYQRVTTNVETSGSDFIVNLFWNDDRQDVDQRVRIVINEGANATAPFGVFNMYMQTIPSGGGQAERAHVSVDRTTSDQAEVVISVPNMQAYATVNNERTAGSSYTSLNFGTPKNIRMTFDGQYIRSRDSSEVTDVCVDKSSSTEQVYGYALFYKESGSTSSGTNFVAGEQVEVNPGIGFTYTDEGESRIGFVSDWGVWTEEPFSSEPTSGNPVTRRVTSQDDVNTQYDLTQTLVDSAIETTLRYVGGDNDGNLVPFGGEVSFENTTLDQTNNRDEEGTSSLTRDLFYFGEGTMGVFNDPTPPAQPSIEFSLRDGAELSSNSINYVVKATNILQQLDPVADIGIDGCDLTLQDLSDNLVDLDDLSGDLFQATEFTEATTAPKYINGELQQN
ncbi:hypothetical protein [Endozoicomonas sp. OPT23]|uniref:hypothetical protein n=1 Tax=Endozoicomonas sp. OPT23 TaxID=2072845 RepID=UPI00129B5236|nr:hypothetical protein [Endozoicomonas sp. OPT23]